MKKILTSILCILLITFSSGADVKKVYVNPLKNTANASSVIAKRLYKKALLGLTKAKTISISSGSETITPGSEAASGYDCILTMNLKEATSKQEETLGSLLGSSNYKPNWRGTLTTEIVIADANTGSNIFTTTLSPTYSDKDKNVALFEATRNFDLNMTDMTDDAFRVSGEVVEATEVNKKNIVKKVRLMVGSKDGARKGQAYELYKVTGNNKEPFGAAKCEQVLNADESILSIAGKKDVDKIISQLIQNNDGSYQIMAVSKAKSGFLRDNLPGFDKLFTNEGRINYMDPFNRSSKPKIGFLAVEINDNNFSSQKDNFQRKVLAGLENVPTIEVVNTVFTDIESAREAGVDGLVDISIDKVENTSSRNKDGSTTYDTHLYFSVAGVDVANNRWIDMKTFDCYGSSRDGKDKANQESLSLLDDRLQKYCEDLFPVSATIVSAEEVKNNEVKKAMINIGTAMGAKKGMTFDIFEQRKEGGAESRFLLGEGKVEKNGLGADTAIIKVKGKNHGDQKLYELLQNADEDTEIILVSKASYDLLEKGFNFLSRDN